MNKNDVSREDASGAAGQAQQDSRKQKTRTIFWVACAVYLLYLAYQLGSGVWSGEVSGGHRVVSILACVLFTAVAVVLLVTCVRVALRSFRESVQAMAEAEAAEEAERAAREALDDGDDPGDPDDDSDNPDDDDAPDDDPDDAVPPESDQP